jgi:SAM-dependent methyltransferase
MSKDNKKPTLAEADGFGMKEIKKTHKTSGWKELFRMLDAIITGRGIERGVSDVGLLRAMCNSPRTFKIIARILMFMWPHNPKKQSATLDFQDNKHLEYVHAYTVTQDGAQNTKGSGRRAERYYQIISLPPRDMSKENILVIGGKNVVELFIAWIYGFKWKNIVGIDLFSLHPKIKIMDMENMLFADESFDNVTMANVYGYQLDPEKCISEISRILKPGGRLCFNSSYDPDSTMPVYKLRVNDMLAIFQNQNFEIIYHTSKNKKSGVSHIWSLQKIDMSDLNLDPILYSKS